MSYQVLYGQLSCLYVHAEDTKSIDRVVQDIVQHSSLIAPLVRFAQDSVRRWYWMVSLFIPQFMWLQLNRLWIPYHHGKKQGVHVCFMKLVICMLAWELFVSASLPVNYEYALFCSYDSLYLISEECYAPRIFSFIHHRFPGLFAWTFSKLAMCSFIFVDHSGYIRHYLKSWTYQRAIIFEQACSLWSLLDH